MEAKDYKRLNYLLSVENTDNRCRVQKLSSLLDNFIWSPYFNGKEFKRGDAKEVISQIELIQEKEKSFFKNVELIKKRKRYKDFIKEYKGKSSGYSMGEMVIVRFTDGIKSSVEIIEDNEKTYKGKKSNKYNKNIKYGLFELDCDFSNNRTKYTEKIIAK